MRSNQQMHMDALGRASWKSQDSPQGRGQNRKCLVVLEVTELKRELTGSVCRLSLSLNDKSRGGVSTTNMSHHVPRLNEETNEQGQRKTPPMSTLLLLPHWTWIVPPKKPRVWNVEQHRAALRHVSDRCWIVLQPFTPPLIFHDHHPRDLERRMQHLSACLWVFFPLYGGWQTQA